MRGIFVASVFVVGLPLGVLAGPGVGRAAEPDKVAAYESFLQRGGIATGDSDLLRLIERHTPKKVDEKELATLIGQLDAAEFKDREKASQALLAYGPAAQKALQGAAKSNNVEISRRASDCLEQIAREKPYVDAAIRVFVHRQPVEGLRALLQLKDQTVRILALNALDSAEAVPLLLETLDDPDNVISYRSHLAIGGVIRPDQFPLVLAAAKDKRPRVRSLALLIFRKFPAESKTVMPLILNALHDESAVVRRAAASVLVHFGSKKETVPAPLEALNDPDVRESLTISNTVNLTAALFDYGAVQLGTPMVTGNIQDNGGRIFVRQYGLFNIVTDGSITQAPGNSADSSVVNQGTFEKTAGGGISTIDCYFENDGTMLLGSGTVSLTNSTTLQQYSATTTLNGGNLACANAWLILGGWLGGVGQIRDNVNNGDPTGQKNGAGTVHPGLSGSAGTLNIIGNYYESSAGILAIDATGVPGGPGLLNVQGNVTFDNNSGVDITRDPLFTPTLGSNFTYLQWTGTLTGAPGTLSRTTTGFPAARITCTSRR
jgi:hypothetical protein